MSGKRHYCILEIELAGRPVWVVDLNSESIEEGELRFNTRLTEVVAPESVDGPFRSLAAARKFVADIIRLDREDARERAEFEAAVPA